MVEHVQGVTDGREDSFRVVVVAAAEEEEGSHHSTSTKATA